MPSINFCTLNLLIILNQNLPIGDENHYDFGKILLSYSAVTARQGQNERTIVFIISQVEKQQKLYSYQMKYDSSLCHCKRLIGDANNIWPCRAPD